MAQTSGTFPQLNAPRMSAKAARAMHAMQRTKRLPSSRGAAPATRVPGGLHTHRAMARAKARGGC